MLYICQYVVWELLVVLFKLGAFYIDDIDS